MRSERAVKSFTFSDPKAGMFAKGRRIVAVLLATWSMVLLGADWVEGALVSGAVTDAQGRPVAGVVLRVTGWSNSHSSLASTEADGRYAIALAPDVYRISVRAPENRTLAVRVLQRVRVQADTTIDIVLRPGILVSGRVTDADGLPVLDASFNAATSHPWRLRRTSTKEAKKVAARGKVCAQRSPLNKRFYSRKLLALNELKGGSTPRRNVGDPALNLRPPYGCR